MHRAVNTFAHRRETLFSKPKVGSELMKAIEPVAKTAPLFADVKYVISARTAGFSLPRSPG